MAEVTEVVRTRRRGRKLKRLRHRFISPTHYHHVSSRTIDGRYAFHIYEPLFVKLAWGIVAAATQKFSIRVAAFVLMSNHLHALVKGPSAVAVSRWTQYVKSNLAVLANRWCGRTGSVWDGRFRSSTLLDAESEVHWFRYIVSHGPKEGLLASPTDWPGAHCAAALRGGVLPVGLLGKAEALAARARGDEDPAAGCAPIQMQFSPLTAWEGRPMRAWRDFCQETIDAVVADHAPAGLPMSYDHADRDWSFVPETLKRSSCPRFDARGPDREALRAAARLSLESAIEHAHEGMFEFVEAGRAELSLYDGLQWPTAVVEVLLPGRSACRPVPSLHSEGCVVEQLILPEVRA